MDWNQSLGEGALHTEKEQRKNLPLVFSLGGTWAEGGLKMDGAVFKRSHWPQTRSDLCCRRNPLSTATTLGTSPSPER